MKKVLVLVWLLIPVLLIVLYYGPFQKYIALDRAADLIDTAMAAEADKEYARAVEAYAGAFAEVPEKDTHTRWQIQLAHARARMFSGELPEGMMALEDMLGTLQLRNAPGTLRRQVRSTLAMAQYYAGWLMRLEGAEPDEWTRQTEAARQNYRLLAEDSRDHEEKVIMEDYQKNLEATIRLARMDLSELEALPLPEEICMCKNVSQKVRKQEKGKGKGKGKGIGEQEPGDARSDGAGMNERPEGTGS
jgi:hypothetical protein